MPEPVEESLFRYRLRVSSRSRHVRLKVTIDQGLEIVIPRGYSPQQVPALIARRQDWIRNALEQAARRRRERAAEPAWRIPDVLSLPALNRAWRISVRETCAAGVTIREIGPGCLRISGAIGSDQRTRAALARWLQRQAHIHLVPWLRDLGRELGLHFRRAGIRRQRTRWGSCSKHRTITLNAKLLFLSPELVRYVLVHELCHLAELNHSRRFWARVARHHPEYRAHDRALREGWKAVPRWAR